MHKHVHPAVTVTAGFFLVLLLQLVDWAGLLMLSLVLFLFACFMARAITLRMLRRMRYLLLVMFALFAWQTPGTLVAPQLDVFSPSVEGLLHASEQILRLLGATSLISLLLEYLDASAWMNSLHVLLQPLKWLGVDADRFILRLRLVLDQVSDQALDWRRVLASSVETESGPPVVWLSRPLSWSDMCLLGLLAMIFLGVCLW